MGDVLVQFDRVGKRYGRRLQRSSLRDAVPALASRLVGRRHTAGRGRGEFWALRDVSFEVRRGEALGIIGHNGAGKSTTLKLLAGVTAPTCGRVAVKGRFAALIELGAGFHPDLTGRENAYLNGSILGLSRAEVARKLDAIVDFAGLEKFIDTPVKYYSSGMHARLGFAVAAHIEPDVLLIDEVLGVGDFAFQQKCMRRMEEFRAAGVAIVFVSHNLDAIRTLCSKAIMLRAGEVAAAGATAEVIEAYTNMAYEIVSDEESAQFGDFDVTRVNRHMEVVAVDLLDAERRPTRSFHAGEAATFTVRLRAHRRVEDPIVGFIMRNAANTIAYDTNSARQKVSIGTLAAGEEIVVSFPLTLNLCASTYSIATGAAPSGGGTVMFDWRENAARFDLFSDQKGEGIADLEASIAVERLTASDAAASPASPAPGALSSAS